MKKLLIAPAFIACFLAVGISAQAQDAAKTTTKKVTKKTVTTTTEEIDASGKKTVKTEKVETEGDSTEEAKSETPEAKQVWAGMPTPNEDWYTLWGLGVGGGKYSGDLGDAYEDAMDAPNVDKSSGGVADLFGFYWPLEGHKTMLGFILTVYSDSAKLANGNEINFSYSMWSFSAQHFFGKNIGNGWYVRGDIGAGISSIDFYDGVTKYSEDSNRRLGFLVGGGYAFAIGEETRLLVGLHVIPLPKMKYDGVTASGTPVSEFKGTITTLNAGFLF